MLPGEAEAKAAEAAAPPQPTSGLVDILVGGKPATVPKTDLQSALDAGATLDDGGTLGSLKAAEVAFGSKVGGGLIPSAIYSTAKRIDPEWAEGWKKNYEEAKLDADKHEVASAVGGGLGMAADMIGPIGKVGGAATKGLAAAAGGGRLAGMGAAGLVNAATMAGYNVGEQVTEDTLHNDPTAPEKLFAAASKDFLFNAGVGAALHGAVDLLSGAGKKSAGLLGTLPKKPGPVGAALADEVAGVDGAGSGVRRAAEDASKFMDDAVKNGATREQASAAWDEIGNSVKAPGKEEGGIADWIRSKQVERNPGLKDALDKGIARRVTSEAESEAFRAKQVNDFVKKGNEAYRDAIDVNNEIAFKMKPEQVERTIGGDFATHLDTANSVAQDAQGFIDRWSEGDAGGLNLKDAQKMVDRYRTGVSQVADRAVGGAEINPKASAQIFTLTDNLKRDFSKLKNMKAEGMMGLPKFVLDPMAEVRGGEGATNYGARAVYDRIRMALEDTNVFGKAGELQEAINRPFSEGFRNESSAMNKLTVALKSEGWNGVPEIHSGKAASFLDAAGRDAASGIDSTDTRSLKDAIQSHIDRSTQLLEHAELTAPERKALERAKVKMAEWGKVVDETVKSAAEDTRVRRMIADEGHGLGHGLAGRIADPFIRPIHSQMALEHLTETVGKYAKKAKGAVDDVFGGWKSAPSEAAAPPKAKAIADEIAGIKEAASNPDVATERASKFIGQDMARIAPKTATSVSTVAARAISYLASQAPQGTPTGGILSSNKTSPPRYSEYQLSQYSRKSEAVRDPAKTVQQAKEGKLSRDGISAIRAVYPNLYQEMRQTAMSQIETMAKSGKLDKMPYEQQLMIGILLDVPANATLTRQFISQMQATKQANPDTPKDGAPQKGGGRRPIDLNAGQFNTESQALQTKTM